MSQFLLQRWDVGYIILSFYVSVVGAFTTIQFAQLFLSSSSYKAKSWFYLVAAAFSLSICSIWSMHFMGMAALKLYIDHGTSEYGNIIMEEVDIRYNVYWTIISIIAAFLPSFLGLVVMSIPHRLGYVLSNSQFRIIEYRTSLEELSGKAKPLHQAIQSRPNSSLFIFRRSKLLKSKLYRPLSLYSALCSRVNHKFRVVLISIAAGTIMASGILTMHYIGMTAMQTKAKMIISPGIVSASVLIGTVACIAAMWLIFVFDGSWQPIISTIVIAVAVCGVHYLGMAAYRYERSTTLSLSGPAVAGNTLGLISTAIVCLFTFIVNGIMLRWYSSLTRLQKSQIQATQNVEDLVNNILPKRAIEKIKSGQTRYSEQHEDVCIMFADLVGFTKYCSEHPKEEVVSLLDDLFSSFDQTAIDFGVEKIKTIGDAYMAACGLDLGSTPEASAQQLLSFGKTLLKEIQSFNSTHGTSFQIRIGMHCGPVIGGVIGQYKWSYDIWGDTVNTASRMESTGIEGRIQVSEEFVNMTNLPKTEFEERTHVVVKGKGVLRTFLENSGPSDNSLDNLEYKPSQNHVITI